MNGAEAKLRGGSAAPRGLVVTHGTLGEELIRTAALIVGHAQGLTALSNRGRAATEIAADVRAHYAEEPESPLLVFVDLLGGSCAQAAGGLLAEPGVRLVTGANLPMLIAFLQCRGEGLALDDMVDAVVMRAHRGIAAFPLRREGNPVADAPGKEWA